MGTPAGSASVPGVALRGKVMGGQQPVSGQAVYLFAVSATGTTTTTGTSLTTPTTSSTGYGQASTSLLNSSGSNTFLNSSTGNYYVLTDANGDFTLTGDYTCPTPDGQVYVYGVGGDPGVGANNSEIGLMAALGSCNSLSTNQPFVFMNELTTVAAAYALAGFATDATHISIPATNTYSVTGGTAATTTNTLAASNLLNAFGNAANLVATVTGTVQPTTAGSNGTIPAARLYTLADILAACINSTGGSSSSACTTLFANAKGGVTGTTTVATDTATAAIYIAQHPFVTTTVMSNLYGLVTADSSPFPNYEQTQPTDFAVAIQYTGGSLYVPTDVAIDASGNAWVVNSSDAVSGTGSISEFSPNGTLLSGSSGYTADGISTPWSIAIDSTGNAWVGNRAGSVSGGTGSVTELASNGGGLANYGFSVFDVPIGIALDASGNIWTGNYTGSNTNIGSINVFSTANSGTLLSGSGYTDGGHIYWPYSIAFDRGGNAWVTNNGGNTLSELNSSGANVSGSPYTVTTANESAGGDITTPYGVATSLVKITSTLYFPFIWITNYSGNGTADATTGSVMADANGTINAYEVGGIYYPIAIAVDGAGNAWVANYGHNTNTGSVTKLNGTTAGGSIGVALSPSTGFTEGGINFPRSIAIDGSGDVWVANYGNDSVTEFIGPAAPVVTPVVQNLMAPYGVPASQP